MEYAFVFKDSVVNIVWLHPMNAEEFPDAVPTDGLPVQIGDHYIDGEFYRDGVKLVDLLTPQSTNPYHIPDETLVRIKDDTVTEIEEAVINGTDE